MEIAIDFDGTCVTHEYPAVGKDIGSVPVLKELIDSGHNLILYTMRSGKQLEDAENWFKIFDIPLYSVQYNPKQKSWTSSNKCLADLYIDDAALGCPLLYNPFFSLKPFVNWFEVKKMLIEKELINLNN